MIKSSMLVENVKRFSRNFVADATCFSTLLVISCVLLFALTAQVEADKNSEPVIQIGLVKHFSGLTTVCFTSDSDYKLTSGSYSTAAPANSILKISLRSEPVQSSEDSQTGIAGYSSLKVPCCEATIDGVIKEMGISPNSLSITPENSDSFIRIAGPSINSSNSLQWHTYSGYMRVSAAGAELSIVDVLPLEKYLYGVLPAEIGSEGPIEALKAQAIAARTFALKNLNKFRTQGFDLDDTTRSEGYVDTDGETSVCTRAVNETKGIVLTFHGQLIDAMYSTDSGGVTACDDTGQFPYFQAVHDTLPGSKIDIGHDMSKHKWTCQIAAAKLDAIVQNNVLTVVPGFKGMSIDGYDASGRITQFTLVGTNGMKREVSGPKMRSVLGPNLLYSTRATMKVDANGQYIFTGFGWGHGFGMSQRGALILAGEPYSETAAQILHRYYVGTDLTPFSAATKLSIASVPPQP